MQVWLHLLILEKWTYVGYVLLHSAAYSLLVTRAVCSKGATYVGPYVLVEPSTVAHRWVWLVPGPVGFQACLMLGCLFAGGQGQVLVHLIVQTSRTGARWLPGQGGPGLVPAPSTNRLEEGLQSYHCQHQCL